MLSLSLSNNAGSTEFQPPRSAMVQSFCGVGKSLANSSATDGSTGRNPACAQTFCPSGVYRKFFSAVALSRWVPDVTTATGFSILNVFGGLVVAWGCFCWLLVIAAFL